MRKGLATVIFILLLIALVLTAGWWLPPLLSVVGANREAIEAVERWIVRLDPWLSVLQTVVGGLLALLALLAALLGLRRPNEPNPYTFYSQQPGERRLSEREFRQQLDRYLDWVIRRHGSARLYGLELQKTVDRRQSLSAIYTSLQVTRQPQGGREPRDRAAPPGSTEMEGRAEPVDMTELLTLGPRLAIVGGAGTGKTTYVDFVASSLATALRERRRLDPRLKPHRARAPLLIPFVAPLRFWNVYRDFCNRHPERALDDPSHGTLVGFLLWYLRDNYEDFDAAKDFFTRLLDGSGVLLMFDGLDEVVKAEERRVVRDAVTELLGRYGDNHCIVTAREAGYRDAPFGGEFLRCDIQPMTAEQIAALVGAWCDILPDLAPTARDELVTIIGTMNEERRAQGQPPLVATPLMVTMVVSVRYNERTLPRERVKLYDAVTRVILRKQYGADADPRGALETLVNWPAPPDKQRGWLRLLAFHMHRGGKGGALVDEATVRAILAPALAERGESDFLEPFIGAMRSRGGLFEERGEQFQFMHLTFQEFLAGEFLAEEWPQWQTHLPAWVVDPWWRETLLLTIGSLDAPKSFGQRQAFVKAMLDVEGNADVRVAAAELVGTGLLELPKAEPPLLDQARARLALFFRREARDFWSRARPTRRAAAGVALARLGDPRPEVTDVDAMQFCLVPAGPFIMGEDDEQRTVEIPYDYWIARFPVTNAQFGQFVAAGGYSEARFWTEAEAAGVWRAGRIVARLDYHMREQRTAPSDFGAPFNLPNHPVVGVTWYEALAFARWLTERARAGGWLPDGHEIVLPSEEEWEKAARGGADITAPDGIVVRAACDMMGGIVGATRRVAPTMPNPLPARGYPWGDDPDPNRANYDDTGIDATSAVGGFPGGVSSYGAEELSGNVWEWTRDQWSKSSQMEGSARVRGGSWILDVLHARGASRLTFPHGHWYDFIGFRMASSSAPAVEEQRSTDSGNGWERIDGGTD